MIVEGDGLDVIEDCTRHLAHSIKRKQCAVLGKQKRLHEPSVFLLCEVVVGRDASVLGGRGAALKNALQTLKNEGIAGAKESERVGGLCADLRIGIVCIAVEVG